MSVLVSLEGFELAMNGLGLWFRVVVGFLVVVGLGLVPGAGWGLERTVARLLSPELGGEPSIGRPETIAPTEIISGGATPVASATWQADLLQILSRPVVVNQAARPPLPEPGEIHHLLDTMLPRFGLELAALPETFRQEVSQRVHDYVTLYRRDIQETLLRADIYLPMIKRVLRQKELPTYYAYIPLVESAFKPDVQHPVSGAGGMWQMIDGTARMYGLEVSDTVDERLDPERATPAAVNYIHALNKRFAQQSSLYVLAAYNYGENNLSRALQRAGTDDIMTLYQKRRLPTETREYLLRMVTMWMIVAQPGRFQFDLAESLAAEQ